MKRFKSPNGIERRVCLSSGHTAIIGGEWRDLEERFWQAAYAEGCVSEDMIQNTLLDRIHPDAVAKMNRVALERDAIKSKILEWIENNETDKFSGKGIPSAVKLTTELSFTVSNHVRDEVWYTLQEEMKHDAA